MGTKISGIVKKLLALVASLVAIWKAIKEFKEAKEVYDALVDLGIPVKEAVIVLLLVAIPFLLWRKYKKPGQLPEKKGDENTKTKTEAPHSIQNLNSSVESAGESLQGFPFTNKNGYKVDVKCRKVKDKFFLYTISNIPPGQAASSYSFAVIEYELKPLFAALDKVKQTKVEKMDEGRNDKKYESEVGFENNQYTLTKKQKDSSKTSKVLLVESEIQKVRKAIKEHQASIRR